MLRKNANWEFVDNVELPMEKLDHSLQLSPILKNLLKQRDLFTEGDIHKFLFPKTNHLHPSKDLSDIEKASNRIYQAIEKKEKILVYGDYDADGVCSTAILLMALEELGASFEYHIPNRFTEGYGPNENVFREAYKRDIKVIITVDTGIAAFHEAQVAKTLGMDLIITDHHEIQDVLPDAYAVINPKCSPHYPFKELAGVGVTFKLAEYLLDYFPEHLLDLVAIGTIADLVPLLDENRVLAYLGLEKLKQTNHIGLRALKRMCRIDGAVTSEDVGFLIGPRLNAVGRIEDASLAVELLITTDPSRANEIAENIDQINTKRQQIVSQIVKEAEKLVDISNNKNIIVVMKEGWNEGVLGIVASRLVRKYDRPAIVLTVDEKTNTAKGSARSIPAFDLFENCMEVRDLFLQFGGHSQAAGMTIDISNVEPLRMKLTDSINQSLTDNDFKPLIEIHQKIDLAHINEELIRNIKQLEPYGMGNPKPVFYVTGSPKAARQLGHKKQHLKFTLHDKDHTIEAIGFNKGNLYSFMTENTTIEVVGELGINEWNGHKTLQVQLNDLEIKEWQLFDFRGNKPVDINMHMKMHHSNLIVGKLDALKPTTTNVKVTSYHDVNNNLENEYEALYINDLPPTLTLLKEIVQKANPKNIFVHYNVEQSVYLKRMPTREMFKKLYTYFFKRKQVDIKKEMNDIIRRSGWSKEKVTFMCNVFKDLNFIIVTDGMIKINANAEKKDLQESITYQERLKTAEIERLLYYSTYEDLMSWFDSCRAVLKEEALHGF